MFYLQDYVSLSMIEEFGMLPVIDLETGDYIGFDIEKNGIFKWLVEGQD